MYISIPVILLIILIWAVNTSTQNEVNDFFGSAWNFSKVLLAGIAVIALLIGLSAFVAKFYIEMFDAFKVFVLIAIISGLIVFAIKSPKKALQALGICVSVLVVFNVGVHLIGDNLDITGLVIVVSVCLAMIAAWYQTVVNLISKK